MIPMQVFTEIPRCNTGTIDGIVKRGDTLSSIAETE